MTTTNEPLAAAAGMLLAGPAAGTAKIAIARAGHVGVTLAYVCLIRGTGKIIALYGRRATGARAPNPSGTRSGSACRAAGHCGAASRDSRCHRAGILRGRPSGQSAPRR
jgi:hypothetical protein